MIDTVDGSEIPRPTTVWMVQKPPGYLPDQLVSRILSINRMFIFQAKVSGQLGLFFGHSRHNFAFFLQATVDASIGFYDFLLVSCNHKVY